MSGRADAVALGDPQPYAFDTKRDVGADYRMDAGHEMDAIEVAELSYLALIGPSTPDSIHVPSLVLWRLFTWVILLAVGAVSLGMRGARRAT
jgi:hypothetical protein